MTSETFQLLMSPLNDIAAYNMKLESVTSETFPCQVQGKEFEQAAKYQLQGEEPNQL